MCELTVEDRLYSSYKWSDPECNINPTERGILSGDVIDENGTVIRSKYRDTKIPGILKISGKTYGRHKKRLLYKCISYYNDFPHILIPYQIKSAFEKNKVDIFILFRFVTWEGKHPRGVAELVIGDVSVNENYYDYQLYCHGLFCKRQKNPELKPKDKDYKTMITKYKVEDRQDMNVISIDPEACTDIDDAIGLVETADSVILSIYITNLPIWVDYFNLWNKTPSCSKGNVASIYLPHKRVSLFSKELERLGSLTQNCRRFALAMDITIPNKCKSKGKGKGKGKDNKKPKIELRSTIIKVSKNYAYDDTDLSKDAMYVSILNTVKQLNKTRELTGSIDNSHDVVDYCMKYMNLYCADILLKKIGIFRTLKQETSTSEEEEKIPESLRELVSLWKSDGASYCLKKDNQGHSQLKGNYTQITSPIRRIVDFVNITLIQLQLGLSRFTIPKVAVDDVYQSIDILIDILNEKMKKIKKVQRECNLLHTYTTEKEDSYDGIVLDKIEGEDEYVIYINKTKHLIYMKTHNQIEKNNVNLIKYKTYKLKLVSFVDEHSFHKKIQYQLSES